MSSSPAIQSTPSSAAIFKLAWPLGLKAAMLHGIVVIDAWLVSALGEGSVAAMGLAATVGGLLLGVLFAFSNATQIRIAQAYGSGDPVSLKSGVYIGMMVNLVSAFLGIVGVWFGGDWIIETFAHTPIIAEQAKGYLSVFMWVVLMEAVAQCLGSYFNGCGRTTLPAFSYLIAIPINVAISYSLIHGLYGMPELGVTGAAVGSAVSSLTRALFLGANFLRLTAGYRDVSGWRNGTFRASAHRHLVFAMPIAGQFISMVIVNNICMLIYAKMSISQFAAMTLINPWVMVAGNFSTAWGMATGIAVAQMLGNGQSGPELNVFLRRAWRGAFVAALIVAGCFLALCLSVDRIYANLGGETRAALVSFLPVLLLLPLLRGSNIMCGHTLRAGGDTLYSMNVHVLTQWLFRVPMVALFVLWLDLSATWVFSLVLFEEILKFPFFHQRVLKGEWRKGPAEE
jgi:Na+-driven multidrug efflux pump